MEISMEDLRVSGELPMIPRVPHGLAAAVEGLTREVMRHRPEDILIFAAHHFEKLLQVRGQYDITMNLPGRNGSTQIIQEMNQALKKEDVSQEGRNKRDLIVECGGWSLNETAKILEKYRSIFAKDEGNYTDEVRVLVNEKNKFSKEGRSGDRARSKEDVRNLNVKNKHRSPERFVRGSPRDVEQTNCTDDALCVKAVPKIIFQNPILARSTEMLALDIKTELRKNRISSKEKRFINEKTGTKLLKRLDTDDVKITEVMKKSTSRWSSRDKSLEKRKENINDTRTEEKRRKKTEIRATANQKQKKIENGPFENLRKMPRTLNTNRVKDYVVRQFVTSKSLEELQSPSYVEKAQKIIDDTAPIIKEKVEKLQVEIGRLKSANKRSRNGYESVDELMSTSERSKKSNQVDNTRIQSAVSRSRRYRRRSNSKGRSRTSRADAKINDPFDGIKTLVTESEISKTEQENGKLKQPSGMESFSEVSSKYAESEQVHRSWSAKSVQRNGSSSTESDGSNYSDVSKSGQISNVSLPAVRALSSKSASRSISRSDSDNLVLPLILPGTPKFAKRKAELILATLPSSSIILSTNNCQEPSTSDATELMKTSKEPEMLDLDRSLPEDTAKTELNLPNAAVEEIFKDSLNVTPDAIDVSLKPDFLQQEKNGDIGNGMVENKLNDMTKKDAKKIGVSEKSEKENKDEGYAGFTVGENTSKTEEVSIKGKMLEVGDTKRRIEIILDFEALKTDKVSIKEKLQEVEDTERRIEGIFNSENITIQEKVDVKGNAHNLKETEQEMMGVHNSIVDEVKLSRDSDLIKSRLVEIQSVEEMIENVLSYRNERSQVAKDIISNVKNVLEEPSNSVTGLSLNYNENINSKVEIRATEHPLKEAEKHMKICKAEGEVVIFETIENVDSTLDTENPSENKGKAAENFTRYEGDNIDRPHVQTPSLSFKTAPYFYILTEGSSYNIPDPVTTVIIPEKLLPSSESNTIDIVLENNVEVRSFLIPHRSKSLNLLDSLKMKDAASSKVKKQLTMKERPLRNILHNFSEVTPLVTVEYSTIDIDFIHGIIVGQDLIVHQDLNQIKEEEDKELMEARKMEVEVEETVKVGTLILDNIQESDENEFQMDSNKSQRLSKDCNESKLVYSSPKITELQKMYSTCLDMGEVKETSVSTDAIHSMISINDNLLEIEESTDVRIIERANEMKEMTLTNHSVNDIAIFSFASMRNASMPLVPDLNLDSLQDSMLSFFRLTDENAGEEDDANQWKRESTVSLTDPLKLYDDRQNTGTDRREVVKQSIVREHIEVKEEPCNRILAYITELDNWKADGEPRKNKNRIPIEIKIVTDTVSRDGEYELKFYEKNNVYPADPQVLEMVKDSHREEFGSNNDFCNSANQEDLEKNEIAKVNSLTKLRFDGQQTQEFGNKDDLHDWEGLVDNKTIIKASPSITHKSESSDRTSSDNLSRLNEATYCASIDRKMARRTEEVEDKKVQKWKVLNTLKTEFPTSREANERLEGVHRDEESCPVKPEIVDVVDDDGTTTGNSNLNIAAAKIEASVRGFLIRRRIRSGQLRSSILNSVSSI